MSSLLKIVAYFLATLFLGALLAPPLFWTGHALGGAWPVFHWLRETEFPRFFNRAMLIAALLLLWPVVRSLRITGWRDLGLHKDPRPWQHTALGFLAACALLWLLGLLLWRLGVYAPRPKIPWHTFGKILFTAAAVGALEEALFRGALQGLVGRTVRPVAALVFVSALFAVLHFFKPPADEVDIGPIHWLSGFVFLPQTFWQWRDPQLVLGGFTTLFLVGLILGYTRLRTRALWLPFGLHAGWVFGLKSFNKSSRHLAPSDFWFGNDLLHGSGPVLTVALTGLLVYVWLNWEARHASPPAA